MAAVMAAMMMPSGGPVPRGMWLIAFGASTGWAALVLARLGPASGAAELTMGTAVWRRAAAPTAHHLVASMFMLYAYGVGHGRHASNEVVAVDIAGPRSIADHAVHGRHSGAGLAGLTGGPLPTPVGVLLGLGFFLWAAWRTVRLVGDSGARSDTATAAARATSPSKSGRLVTGMRSVLVSRALISSCSIVTGVGMGVMAFAMS